MWVAKMNRFGSGRNLKRMITSRQSWTLPDVRPRHDALDSRLQQLARDTVRTDIASFDKTRGKQQFNNLRRASAPGQAASDGSWRRNFKTLKDRTHRQKPSKLPFSS
jgi:hypothetical protein